MYFKPKFLQKDNSKLCSRSLILKADEEIIRPGKDKRRETIFYTLCLKIHSPNRNQETKPDFISSSRTQPAQWKLAPSLTLRKDIASTKQKGYYTVSICFT